MKTSSWQEFRQKAALDPQRIVLVEGEDPRMVRAAGMLQSQNIARPTLIGSHSTIERLWKQSDAKNQPFTCIDPATLPAARRQTLAAELGALRKYRELSDSERAEKLKDPLILGALLLRRGDVDGFVGGATRTTGDTVRAVFSIIGLAPTTSTLFGFFLIESRATAAESPRIILLGDCAVVPDPSAKQLAQIGIGAAEAYRLFLQSEPKVVFLSFSTGGSASHPFVDKIREALQKAREKAPGVAFDGEWQVDAALDPFAAQIKGVGRSPLAGQANVLIAPDLNSGNIAYKLVQRLGQCRAVGPVLWGTAKPANDLSRGCSVDDIVDMAALTAIQAQHQHTGPASTISAHSVSEELS